MTLTPSPTELTTAASDAALAVLSLVLFAVLVRTPAAAPWRKAIWATVFALLAAGAALGAVAHGLDLTPAAVTTLFRPLYLSLALSVALFLVGAIGDWRGWQAARTVLPWAMAAAVGFFAATQVSDRGFMFFIQYEGVAMVAALLIYLFLWAVRRFGGAGRLAAGIALTLVAAAVQVSSLSFQFIGWTFDHNGLFHLVQLVAVVVMASGLHAGMSAAQASSPDQQVRLEGP